MVDENLYPEQCKQGIEELLNSTKSDKARFDIIGALVRKGEELPLKFIEDLIEYKVSSGDILGAYFIAVDSKLYERAIILEDSYKLSSFEGVCVKSVIEELKQEKGVDEVLDFFDKNNLIYKAYKLSIEEELPEKVFYFCDLLLEAYDAYGCAIDSAILAEKLGLFDRAVKYYELAPSIEAAERVARKAGMIEKADSLLHELINKYLSYERYSSSSVHEYRKALESAKKRGWGDYATQIYCMVRDNYLSSRDFIFAARWAELENRTEESQNFLRVKYLNELVHRYNSYTCESNARIASLAEAAGDLEVALFLFGISSEGAKVAKKLKKYDVALDIYERLGLFSFAAELAQSMGNVKEATKFKMLEDLVDGKT